MSAYYVLATEGHTKGQKDTGFTLRERTVLVVLEEKYIELRRMMSAV